MQHSMTEFLKRFFIATLLPLGGSYAGTVLAAYTPGGIYTVARNGSRGYSGDNSPPTSVLLNGRMSVLLKAVLFITLFAAGSSVYAAPMSLITTITNIGYVNDLALSANNGTLFIGSTDSCVNAHNCPTPSLNGGLYSFNVTNPSTPIQVGHGLYPTTGYKWTGYNTVRLSADGNSAFIASGEQEFQIIDTSATASLPLKSRLSTGSQAMGLTLSPDGLSVFVSTSASNILQISVANPLAPVMSGNANTGPNAYQSPQIFQLSMSPDGSQVAGASQGQAIVVDTSSGSLGAVTNSFISAALSGASALDYVGNKTVLMVSKNYLAVVDLTVPASPVLISQISSGNSAAGGMAGVKYISATHLAYVSIGNTVNVVDLSNLTAPVVRGSITLPSTITTAGMTPTGITASADGATIYVVNNGNVAVIQVGGNSPSVTNQAIGTIIFSPTTLPVGGSTTASATSSSGLSVSFSSTTPSICTVSGSTITGVAAGTCTITANQAGNASYNAAPQMTQSIQVTQAAPSMTSQTIGPISFSPTTIAVGGTSVISANATSGLAVTFTSMTPSICTITTSKSSIFSNNTYTVSGVASGTCTIAANQTGGTSLTGGTYSAAPQVTQNLVIGTSRTDCLFNWAERTYPQYFAPAVPTDATLATYTYRYYSGTKNYLAVSSTDNNVYVLGPVSGNTLVQVGPVASFLGVSGCQ